MTVRPAVPPSRVDAEIRALLDEDLEDLYEHAPCGHLSALPDGTVVRVNETLLGWTGHRREDLVGRRRWSDLLPPGQRLFHETHLGPLLRMQGRLREISLDLVTAGGEHLPVLVNAVLHRTPDGEPRLLRLVLLDATERTTYERELLRARRDAEQSERRVRLLQRVAADLAGATGLRATARVLVEAATGPLGAPSAEVWLLESEGPGGRGAALLTAQGVPPAGPGCPLAVPLEVDGRAVGRLVLHLPGASPEGPDTRGSSGTRGTPDPAVLEVLARQGAQALDRARLHEETAAAARRSALLADTGRALDEVSGVSERAQRLVELLVPAVADGALVELARGRELEVAAVAHRGAEVFAELVPGPGRPAAWRPAVSRAAATGVPQLHSGVEPLGEPSRLALPLRARGQSLGVLLLVREPGRPFTGSDVEPLAELADRAGLALENARLHEQEREVALALQRSLLAGAPPEDARLRVVTRYSPAVGGLEVGGDFHDAFRTGPDTVALVVGDVVGRGLAAASAMGQLRSAVRALALDGGGPARVLTRLDAFVETLPAARMATLLYAELDLETGLLRWASAGHPPPVLLAPALPAALRWEGRSAPLGSRTGHPTRGEAEVRLVPGTRVLLCTDGLVERRRRPLDDGLALLLSGLDRGRSAPLPALVEAVTDALLGDERADDACLLAASWGRLPLFERSLAADLAELVPLRAALQTWLRDTGVADRDAAVVLEGCLAAVADAVQCGYDHDRSGLVLVAAGCDEPDCGTGQAVRVRVHDRGPGTDCGDAPVPHPDDDPYAGLDVQRLREAGGRTVVLTRRTGAPR